MALKTKCVHSPISQEEDGLRLLVTRHRGRGMSASRYDLWLPALGPSESLLNDILNEEITWREFSKRYRDELWSSESEVDERNKTIKNNGQKNLLRMVKYLARRQTVTLMCHCEEDCEYCHRYLLKDLILSKKVTL